MSRRENWNSANFRIQRPRGLRGKQIGLYYRDLQKNKNKTHNYVVTLSIPPRVLSGLHKNIETIKQIAKACNIIIPPPNKMKIAKIKYDTSASDFKPVEINQFAKFYKSNSSDGPSTSSDCKQDDYEFMEQGEEFEDFHTDTLENFNGILFDEPEVEQSTHTSERKPRDSLKGAGDYKYGYEDIITGTFEEKLEECLSKGTIVSKGNCSNSLNGTLNDTLYEQYIGMTNSIDYLIMKTFREGLPTYKKRNELLDIINNNQVIVISGETGCGKSTQIPQIILDDAIVNKKGANVRILVTQPRRIAASSLAMRVASERSETLGVSVGYNVRLEGVEPRKHASIKFCTTGVLLVELEVDQGLTKYSHVILDEVHERDCHIDISMLSLKQVLKKRKDLKLILMSATIDADKLTSYFGDCPMMHIEGLAYPVKDVYLEDILSMTKYIPSYDQDPKRKRNQTKMVRKKEEQMQMQRDIKYKAEIAPWLESIKKNISRDIYIALQDARIEDLNIDLIYELLLYICKGEPGAILVFLPGISEITRLLNKINSSNFFPKHSYDIYPLHSKLPSLEQHKIFQRPPGHKRKIIIATNIAETSITIDDIVYVIDGGKLKYQGLNVEENVSTLQIKWISQANLRQRRGRAGRCQPGICYHLFTTYRASQLEERLLPEIQRDTLLEPVLSIKRLRLGKAGEAMSMMASPPAETTVERAVKHLRQVGALDSNEKLTPLGWHLARLPVHPAAGKLLLLGTLFGCLNRAASVAAVWSFKDPFQLVIGREREINLVKRSLALGEPSDHVAISEAIIQFEKCGSYKARRNFAHENFLAFNTLELLSDMKRQLANNLKDMGFLHNAYIKSAWENRNEHNISLFKAIIAASLYPNIATVRWKHPNRGPHAQSSFKTRTPEDGNLAIHPSSALSIKTLGGMKYPLVAGGARPGPNWLVYWLKQRSTELYLIDVTLVHTLPFLFFGELVVSESQDPSNYCIFISNVKVSCKKTTMDLLWQMRSLLDQVLASKIGDSTKHGTKMSPFENQVLDAVMELIIAEEERAEFIGDNDSESDTESDDSVPSRSWRPRR